MYLFVYTYLTIDLRLFSAKLGIILKKTKELENKKTLLTINYVALSFKNTVFLSF